MSDSSEAHTIELIERRTWSSLVGQTSAISEDIERIASELIAHARSWCDRISFEARELDSDVVNVMVSDVEGDADHLLVSISIEVPVVRRTAANDGIVEQPLVLTPRAEHWAAIALAARANDERDEQRDADSRADARDDSGWRAPTSHLYPLDVATDDGPSGYVATAAASLDPSVLREGADYDDAPLDSKRSIVSALVRAEVREQAQNDPIDDVFEVPERRPNHFFDDALGDPAECTDDVAVETTYTAQRCVLCGEQFFALDGHACRTSISRPTGWRAR